MAFKYKTSAAKAKSKSKGKKGKNPKGSKRPVWVRFLADGTPEEIIEGDEEAGENEIYYADPAGEEDEEGVAEVNVAEQVDEEINEEDSEVDVNYLERLFGKLEHSVADS